MNNNLHPVFQGILNSYVPESANKSTLMNDAKEVCHICEQCNQYADELFSFNGDIKRCSDCMKVEGLCHECGDYIPLPDPDNENDPLWQLDDSSDYAPTQCLCCFSKAHEPMSISNDAEEEVCYNCGRTAKINCVGLCYDCDLFIHG